MKNNNSTFSFNPANLKVGDSIAIDENIIINVEEVGEVIKLNVDKREVKCRKCEELGGTIERLRHTGLLSFHNENIKVGDILRHSVTKEVFYVSIRSIAYFYAIPLEGYGNGANVKRRRLTYTSKEYEIIGQVKTII